jgi:hypothetical protein
MVASKIDHFETLGIGKRKPEGIRAAGLFSSKINITTEGTLCDKINGGEKWNSYDF